MADSLFHLSEGGTRSLRSRLRELLVATILDGHIPSGEALPSSRKPAQQLGVGRNTVLFVYEQLVDEGYLVTRERLGYFVSEDIDVETVSTSDDDDSVVDLSARLALRPSARRNITKPRNWRSYPYPFVFGQLAPDLFPATEWRGCYRHALTSLAIQDWAPDHMDRDDPQLTEQLRTRVLPARGVWAEPGEILVTLGAQHALFLLADLTCYGAGCARPSRNVGRSWLRRYPVIFPRLQCRPIPEARPSG